MLFWLERFYLICFALTIINCQPNNIQGTIECGNLMTFMGRRSYIVNITSLTIVTYKTCTSVINQDTRLHHWFYENAQWKSDWCQNGGGYSMGLCQWCGPSNGEQWDLTLSSGTYYIEAQPWLSGEIRLSMDCNQTSVSPTTYFPSSSPTSALPTNMPTVSPTTNPTFIPSKYPTTIPTKAPTSSQTPTKLPSYNPTNDPTNMPTTPTKLPTNIPTKFIAEYEITDISSTNINNTKNALNGKNNSNSVVTIALICSISAILFLIIMILFVYYKKTKMDKKEPGAPRASVEMKSRAPEMGNIVSSSNEQDKKIENIKSSYNNEGNNDKKENENKNNKQNMDTDGRWYSPQQEDDIYSDEVSGVEPIIKKGDKWKHAFVLDKTPQETPQHEGLIHNDNNKQTITMENNSAHVTNDDEQ